MPVKKISSILFILIIFLLSSCRPGQERGLIGGSENCVTSNNSGSCSGFFTQVYGENLKSFDNVFVLEDSAIYLNLTVKSTNGKMTIGIKEFGIKEDWKTIDIEPGAPVTFKGWVIPDENGLFTIQFTQLENTKTGRVIYNFEYLR